MPKKIASPRSKPPRWARIPAEIRMVSPGSGTPVLSAITPKKTIRYPYWEMRWRMLSIDATVVGDRLGRPQTPDGDPQRVDGTDADQPEEGGEVAGQHVRRVVHPKVEPGKADQEHHEYPQNSHGPASCCTQPVRQDEREHPVEPDGDGGVAARERIEGGVVAGVEELGTRPLEYTFQDGSEHDAPGGRDQEEYGGEPPASLVEERYDHDQEQQHEPVVAERCDDTHRPVEPAGEGRVDPEQHSPVESAALALDNHVGQPGKGPD